MTSHHSQSLVHLNQASYSITADRFSQLRNWAMVWMYSSPQTVAKQNVARRSQIIETLPSPSPTLPSPTPPLPSLDKAFLYKATCQKLRPRNKYKLLPLGGIIQIRKCLDTLEQEIYHELSQKPSYTPPSKRMTLNPDKFVRKGTVPPYKRNSFASSTLVYSSSGSTMRIQSIQALQDDDDDDVPLGKLIFSSSHYQH